MGGGGGGSGHMTFSNCNEFLKCISTIISMTLCRGGGWVGGSTGGDGSPDAEELVTL